MIVSRPLRFLAVTVGGWIAFRTMMLWPVEEILPDIVRTVAPGASAQPVARPAVVRVVPPAIRWSGHAYSFPELAKSRVPGVEAAPRFLHPAADPAPAGLALAGFVEPGPAASIATPGSDTPPAFLSSRLSGSAWAIVRSGGRATPFASQLGGSQAGVRLAYAIDAARRLAVTARFSAALGSRQREASVGVDWRPTSLPIHLVVEERIALDGGRGGPAAGAIGGIGPSPIGAGFRLEAYGQAGFILRDGGEGFADGSVRVSHPVARIGRATLDAGAGAWGGAQRDAERLDIGPSIGASVPVGHRTLRVALDWRQRIAGGARPDSGPALSLGTDF